MYLNDTIFILNDLKIYYNYIKIVSLLHADDIVIVSNSESDSQHGPNLLQHYCSKWKLAVNVPKTPKYHGFSKIGETKITTKFTYNGKGIKIANKFKHLGEVFSTRVSYKARCDSLIGQALKSLFKLRYYMVKKSLNVCKSYTRFI